MKGMALLGALLLPPAFAAAADPGGAADAFYQAYLAGEGRTVCRTRRSCGNSSPLPASA